MRRVDPQRPRQRRRRSVQFLVEVVTEPADRLCEDQPGRNRIGERPESDAAPPAADPGAQRTQRDRTPDAQPSVPDEEGPHGLLAGGEVELRVGDHVVEPPADDPERHRPQRHVEHVSRATTPGCPPLAGDPCRHDDAEQDAQRVGADGDRPQMPHPTGWAGDTGQDHRSSGCIGVVAVVQRSQPLAHRWHPARLRAPMLRSGPRLTVGDSVAKADGAPRGELAGGCVGTYRGRAAGGAVDGGRAVGAAGRVGVVSWQAASGCYGCPAGWRSPSWWSRSRRYLLLAAAVRLCPG